MARFPAENRITPQVPAHEFGHSNARGKYAGKFNSRHQHSLNRWSPSLLAREKSSSGFLSSDFFELNKVVMVVGGDLQLMGEKASLAGGMRGVRKLYNQMGEFFS